MKQKGSKEHPLTPFDQHILFSVRDVHKWWTSTKSRWQWIKCYTFLEILCISIRATQPSMWCWWWQSVQYTSRCVIHWNGNVITGCTESENLLCSLGWKFRQFGNISVSVSMKVTSVEPPQTRCQTVPFRRHMRWQETKKSAPLPPYIQLQERDL